MNWQALRYADLEDSGCIADVNQGMAGLLQANPDISAAECSELILGRRDHSLFLSMWMCLFHDVELTTESWSKRKRDSQAVEGFLKLQGVAPCPHTWLDVLDSAE